MNAAQPRRLRARQLNGRPKSSGKPQTVAERYTDPSPESCPTRPHRGVARLAKLLVFHQQIHLPGKFVLTTAQYY
jgi:hypothetical protein